jgi:hypothetical protein
MQFVALLHETPLKLIESGGTASGVHALPLGGLAWMRPVPPGHGPARPGSRRPHAPARKP